MRDVLIIHRTTRAYSAHHNSDLSLYHCCKAEEKKGDEKKLVTTAVLSTTVKAKARVARKEAKKHG